MCAGVGGVGAHHTHSVPYVRATCHSDINTQDSDPCLCDQSYRIPYILFEVACILAQDR